MAGAGPLDASPGMILVAVALGALIGLTFIGLVELLEEWVENHDNL